MKFYYGKDNQGYWRWRLVAANNLTIAVSSESYHNESDCLASINLVKSSSNAPVYKV